jgi:hypothetical protein
MADHPPLPMDSLHCVLAHVETEWALHEHARDDPQFDVVYKHAIKLREWLSDIDELGDAMTFERSGTSAAPDGSETPAP